MGGTLTIVDANWDAGEQSKQIASFVGSKPDALFVCRSG
ncbi:ABC-type sugar transport system substrate-binding protein [Bradyrhizobium elkanii]|nr:ABC-type sugar transport system substrate-binding protein [Bradyrhizobium elkanii]